MRRLRVVFFAALLTMLLAVPAMAQDTRVDLGVLTVKTKRLAQTLRARIQKGASFEALAKKHSVGPAASRGGRLGSIPVNRLRSEYRRALKNLAPGRPSAVIPTEEGFTLLIKFVKAAAPQTAARQARGMHQKAKPQRSLPPAQEAPQFVARTLVAAGVEAMAAGDFKTAREKLKASLAKNPHESSAGFFDAICRQAQKGQLKVGAAKSFAKGFLLMIQAKVKDAQALFKKAFDADPRMWQAALFEADAYAEQREYAKSNSLLNKVLAINPKSPRAHISLGVNAIEQEQLNRSLEELRTAIKLDPKMAEAHYHLGSILMVMGKFGEAKKHLHAVLASDPYREEAYNDLALIMTKQGDYKGAEKNLKKALELNPGFAVAHVSLGQVYARQKKYNRAIDEFTKALMIAPNIGAAHSNLAAAYMIQKKWGQAIKHADRAKALGFMVPPPLLKALKPHRR